jgi:hypothetical protein
MNDQHAPPPAPAAAPRPSWTQRLFNPSSARGLLLALATGAAAAGGGWWFWLKPHQELARVRFETDSDVLKLYGLQLRYKKAKGTYASDLDALLSLEPDAAARKARMADHMDLATLTIVGDAKKFKIEANVLDAERTLVKIRGPIQDRPAPRSEANVRETGIGPGGDGLPVAPAQAPAPTAAPRAR